MIKPLFPLVRFFSRSSNGLVPSSPSTATTLDPGMIVPMLDRMDGLTTIVGHDRWGFNVNGIFMRGSILVFKNYTMLWNVSRAVDVSPRALAPLHMLRPKPDFVLVGTGSDKAAHINPAVYAYLSRKGISLEVMSTVRWRHALESCYSAAGVSTAHRVHTFNPLLLTMHRPKQYTRLIFSWRRVAMWQLLWWHWSPCPARTQVCSRTSRLKSSCAQGML